jgi:hypothetical protein
MNIKKQKSRGGTMNVRFTNVTRQYLNRICSFVYDFSRPATVAEAQQQIARTGLGGSAQRPLGRRER